MLLVAAGKGVRMQQSLPKQFMRMGKYPVLMHTLQAFHLVHWPITLVLPAEHLTTWHDLCQAHDCDMPHKVIAGGTTRFQSVKKGLASLTQVKDDHLVLIQDGVRPFVSLQLIQQCVETAHAKGSAVSMLPCTESVRRVSRTKKGNFSANASGIDKQHMPTEACPREEYFHVQTPQVFRYHMLQKAYACEEHPHFTDDATVIEKAGFPVYAVNGESTNLKITHPMDIACGEQLLQQLG